MVQPKTPRCQLCAKRPGTIERSGELADLHLCTARALKVLPGVLGDALVKKGIPGEMGQKVAQAVASCITQVQDLNRNLPSHLQRPVPTCLPFGVTGLCDDGLRAGKTWAEQFATEAELRAIAAYHRELGTGCLTPLEVDAVVVPTSGARAFHAVVRPHERSRDLTAEFWQSALDEGDRGKERHGEFVVGFGEAALDVWLIRYAGGWIDSRELALTANDRTV
jgi:hypothetical protein